MHTPIPSAVPLATDDSVTKASDNRVERLRLGAQDGIPNILADHEEPPGQRGAVRPKTVFETHDILLCSQQKVAIE